MESEGLPYRPVESIEQEHKRSPKEIQVNKDFELSSSKEPEKDLKKENDSDEQVLKRIKRENGTPEKVINVVPNRVPQLFYTPLKTGLVYDVRMRYHAKIFTSYFDYIDPHPEDPRRIYRIYKKLAEAGIIQDSSLSGTEDLGPLVKKIPTRDATSEEVLEVHSEEHLEFIKSTEIMTRERLLEETEKGDSIYVNNDSYRSAKLSCGGAIEACKAVIEGKVKNAAAIIRPPGHHAEPNSPGGFCLFSNVAVAAKSILKKFPESVRRIVVVDWDVHHGNGTQKAFYDDPRVLYISLHRYENGKFYPGTKYGNSTQTGEGEGEGYTLNIPWKTSGMGDGDYFFAFNKVIMPVITEFDPDLVIVSSGFDAADGDVIGGCHVSPVGYGYMTHALKSIAKGKLCVVLEGGYNLDAISESALAVAKVLIGEPPEGTIKGLPREEAIEVIDEVIKVQSKYWNCLKPSIPQYTLDNVYDLPENEVGYEITNTCEAIRAHQESVFESKYSFISLPIVDIPRSDTDSSSYFSTYVPSLEDVVLASEDVYKSSTLVICIHDPPEIWANINPINGTIEGSASVVLEHPLTQIIEKIKQEQKINANLEKETIGYMDINIPSFLSPIPFLKNQRDPSIPAYNPTIFSQELLLYIWDNYLAYFSHLQKVVFVGFGESYQAILHLYSKRSSYDVKELVKGTVVFVNKSSLRPLVSSMDESMIDWYYKNSVIFTSYLNPCWSGLSNGQLQAKQGQGYSGSTNMSDETSKKPRRKFGRVLKCSVDGLWDVINERFDEGVDFILDSIEDYSSDESS